LSTRCFTRIRSLHHAPAIKDSVEDVVFPGRRSLGAQAAELAALVQDGERLDRSMVQCEPHGHFEPDWQITEICHVDRSGDISRYFRLVTSATDRNSQRFLG